MKKEKVLEKENIFTNKKKTFKIKTKTIKTKTNFKLTKKTKEISDQPPIEIIPPQIVFHNVEPKKIYEIKFSIRNKTLENIKVKINQPKSNLFKVEYNRISKIAPGLSIIAKVIFRAQNKEELFSNFKIFTENYGVEVPISVFPPSAFLVFKPFLDFGFVDVEKKAKKYLKVKNEGLKHGEVNFIQNEGFEFEIEPSSISLNPGESQKVGVTFFSNKTGLARQIINLKIEGHSIYKAIEISANVVKNDHFIFNEKGEEKSSKEFKDTLIGQKKKKKIIIINNSPKQKKFQLNILRGSHRVFPEQTQLQTPFEKGRELTEQVLYADKNKGIIEPYEKFELSFFFNSSITDYERVMVKKIAISEKCINLDSKVYEYTAVFEFENQEKESYLQLSAFCYFPQIRFDKTSFDFDEIMEKNVCSKILKVKNYSDKLGVKINCPREFFLHCKPSKFFIKPMEEREVEIIFKPKNLGIINKKLNFKINTNFDVPVKIFGFVHSKNSNKKLQRFYNSEKIEKIKTKIFYIDRTLKLKLPEIKSLDFNKNKKSIKLNPIQLKDTKIKTKELSSKPVNREQARIINEKLDGKKLMNIQVGDVTLDFGKIFVQSTSSKFFQITNNLTQPIKARIDTKKISELSNSYLKPQIIPEEKRAHFKLTIRSETKKIIHEKISYIINENHVFNLLVKAEVVPVEIKIEEKNLNFKFEDDSLEMRVVKKLKLINDGNSDAKYRFKIPAESAFEIALKEGLIEKGKIKYIEVVYNPKGIKDKGEIIMEIENGLEKIIFCEGSSNETLCKIYNEHIDFGTIAIGKKKLAYFELENLNNKYYSIFKIDKKSLPHGVTIKPEVGKIVPDDKQKFELQFTSKKKIELKKKEFSIFVRGSKKINVFLSVKTILPDISIEEPCFDFKQITFGTKGSLPFMIKNKSPINAELLLKLTSPNPHLQEKYDCIDIIGNNDKNNESIIFEKIADKNENIENINSEFNQICKNYVFFLKANKSYNFLINFSPVKPNVYDFELPFFINGHDDTPLFIKKVSCIGSSPKFIMDPLLGVIEFQRKIIISSDSVVPEYKTLTISNPNFEEPLIWRFDKEVIENQKLFSIIPISGVIEPQCMISLNIGFQPLKPEKYELSIPLYLENDDKPYTDIKLKGEGAFPKLLFDVQEVILETVPLNHKSSYVLNIFNDGYNNSNISSSMIQEYSDIPIKLNFLNGSTIGINNPKLKVEISFISSEPISFTTRIDFEDDQKRIFSIFVSGTCDNSILTNYLFFLDNPKYEIGFVEKKGPQMITVNDSLELQHSISQSQMNSFQSTNFQKEKFKNFEKLTEMSNTIKSWFKEYGIASIEKYPEEVINSNGSQIYDLINFLIKNNLSKPNLSNTLKKNEKVKAIYDSYLKLLNFLKEHNAMLNTIRPHFLLSYKNLLIYFKNNSNKFVHKSYYKFSEKKYNYYSLKSWILLFNQIIKIFFVSRINLKSYKQSLSNISKFEATNFDYSIEKNSLYSTSELLLFKWLEVLKKSTTGVKTRYFQFDNQLSDCLAFSSAIENYILLDLKLVSQLKQNPITQEEFLFNYEKTKKIFHKYGIKDELSQKEFLYPNCLSFLLLTIHLFKTLPNFLPRGKIEFNCSLHESITKEISFSNPANKTIIYAVRLFGHPNFKIDSEDLKLEPKQNATFPINYYANTSLPAEGKIIFQNLKNGNSIAGAICFNLKAKVDSRFSMRNLTIRNMNLYEMGTTEIEINNPFDKDVDFKIIVENVPYKELKKQNKKKTKKNNNKTKNNKKKNKKSNDNKKDLKKKLIPSFFLRERRVWINKNSTSKIHLIYLPMTFETHKCNLIFLDPKVGEMQYEVVGVPKLPINQKPVFNEIKKLDELKTLDLKIPQKNELFNIGAAKLLEKLKETNEKELVNYIKNLSKENNSIYNVEVLPQGFFLHPSKLRFDENSQKRVSGQNASTIAINTLSLTPITKTPVKDLEFKIILKDEKKIDIKMFNLNLTILPKVVQATIEMHTTARVAIKQEIPISNPTNVDCLVKPTFIGICNTNCFVDMNLNSFTVKKNSVFNYPVCYLNEWVGRAEAKLNLFNQYTNDNFEYIIKADSEEPLSENNVKFSTKAKKISEIVFEIKNPIFKSKKFKVECDIANAEFQREVFLDFDKTCKFKINFTPKVGGQFMNAITFKDEAGKYFWYLITLTIDPPECADTFDIFTEIRKPIVCKIEVPNNTDKDLDFQVVFHGSGLNGEKIHYVENNSSNKYDLIYYPFKIEKKKCKIGFLNELEGEIWYDLNIQSVDSKPERLSIMSAELGKTQQISIFLKNPLIKKKVKVKCDLSKKSNFNVSERKFILDPNQKREIIIYYKPTDLNKKETEVLNFYSKELGCWKYILFGIGVPPTDFETTTINSIIKKPTSKTISFKNPFDTEICVQIVLESEYKVFELLMHKTKNVMIQARGTLQYAIKFLPSIIKTYKGKIYIKLNKKIFWVFPIKGITEAPYSNKDIILKTKSGKETEKHFSLKIEGLDNIDKKEAFTYKLQIKHKEQKNIEKWFKIKSIKDKIDKNGDEISYVFSLLPYKPFKTHVELLISRKSGGRWRVKILLEALEPDYFETFNIVSQLNVKTNVQFKLYNNDKKISSDFLAYFTQDSDTEFSVLPKKGVLQPVIKDGTDICVSYLPVEYGKLKVGKLIVENDSFMWKFLVKGAFKKYYPPNKKRRSRKVK